LAYSALWVKQEGRTPQHFKNTAVYCVQVAKKVERSAIACITHGYTTVKHACHSKIVIIDASRRDVGT